MKNMKKILICLVLALLTLTLTLNAYVANTEYIRVHIRANSNDEVDQNIKYLVRNEVVKFLTPKLASAVSREESLEIATSLREDVETLVDEFLCASGFEYSSKVEIRKEYFPSREYDELYLRSGIYDSVLVSLGEGQGDNWWCVVYPPMCFIGGEDAEGEEIIYKSLIYELAKEGFRKKK